jgi:hypothetical protein
MNASLERVKQEYRQLGRYEYTNCSTDFIMSGLFYLTVFSILVKVFTT